MGNIGIVVCNFNKADYVKVCLDSIFASDVNNFDVYVVDNASTDESVEMIRREFGDKVKLLINEKNLGGSGGFNTGLREVLKKDYEYLMCVDNDIRMEKDTIRTLYEFLERNKDVGMVGSKICFMDDPERIQTYGATIDFETYGVHDLHRGCLNDHQLPEVQYCDYVPACSLMARVDVVKEVGIMPEDNFIYWDDMEWGYRFNLAGYKVAAITASNVYHKGGKNTNPTTFQKYYMIRNRLNFFMKYVAPERREHFVKTILAELYRSICGCYLKKEYNMVKGFMYAYDDALHGVRGVADSCKIIPREAPDRFLEIVNEKSKVAVLFDGNYEGLSNLKRKLASMISLEQMTIIGRVNEDTEALSSQYPDCKVVAYDKQVEHDVLFQLCQHVFMVEEIREGAVCVDQWLNLLITEQDYSYGKNYNANQEFFIMCNEPIFMECIKRVQG